MPYITPAVSSELRAELDNAKALWEFVSATHPEEFQLHTDELTVVTALYALVSEHCAAILYLLEAGGLFDGSAFALARPLIEGCFRAHWLYACGREADVETALTGGNPYPPFKMMVDDVESKLETGFFPKIKGTLENLHGYTHGGLEQLGRRFDQDGNVRPTYEDALKVEFIRASMAYYWTLAIAWAALIDSGDGRGYRAAEAISDEAVMRYKHIQRS